MPTPASLSSPTAAPTGFEAVRETLSNLLLLLVIAMIATWAERLIASLRQRTETTDLTDITRDFGTTDIALILERLTTGLQRLRELEDKVRRSHGRPRHRPAARIHERPLIPAQSVRIAATRPHARGHVCPLAPRARADGHRTGPRHRPTPNPRLSPQNPTGPVHPLTPRGMDGPAVPIPPPPAEPDPQAAIQHHRASSKASFQHRVRREAKPPRTTEKASNALRAKRIKVTSVALCGFTLLRDLGEKPCLPAHTPAPGH